MSIDGEPPSKAPQSNRAIFLAALKLGDEPRRRAFLDQACGGDAARREEIERLLAACHAGASNPLDQAVAQLGPAESRATDADRSLKFDVSSHPLIDRYKLLEQIGEGGMGAVFMAQQTEPIKRKVALKLIKPGMDSREVISRFQAERQALAMMDHPHIAQVLDAGTTAEGRPYFVMELVRGVPITQYCDDNRLAIPDRLRLLVDVCRAVQHAHQKGIIHRDLKPSNVMVTLHDGTPVVKVIDFGVAKALNQELTQRTLFTQFSQMIGTPLYMSPEQAEMSGLDVDTRSDVYSLGVLLYELLTGTTPFDKERLSKAGFDDMRRIICEEEPSRPSHKISTLDARLLSTVSTRRNIDGRQLALSMRRELDWIAMKALEKDRNRRYESASALAQEVQRYLDDEPVEACPPSMSYRLKKAVKRQKRLLAMGAVLSAMLVTSSIVSALFAVQAQKAQKAAHESATIAKTAQQVAEQEKENALALEQQALESKRMAEENLAAALDAVDKLLEHVSAPELNEVPRVQSRLREILQDSLAFYDQFKVTSGDSPQVRYRAALTRLQLGRLARQLGENRLSLNAIDDSQSALEELKAQFPNEARYQTALANVHMQRGWHYSHITQEYGEAISYFEKAMSGYAAVAQLDSDRRDYFLIREVKALQSIADVHERRGDRDQFAKLMLAAHDQLSRLDASVDQHSTELGVNFKLVKVLQEADPGRAEILLLETLDKSRQRLTATGAQADRNWHVHHLLGAEPFLRSRNVHEANRILDESFTIAQALKEDFPDVRDHGNLLARVGARKVEIDRERAIEDFTAALRVQPESQDFVLWRSRGLAYFGLQQYERAVSDFSKAIELEPGDIWSVKTRGLAHHKLGRLDLALCDLNACVERNPSVRYHYVQRASILRDLGEFEAALADCEKAVAIDPESDAPWFRREEAHALRGDIHAEDLRQYDKAADAYSQALELDPANAAVREKRDRALRALEPTPAAAIILETGD